MSEANVKLTMAEAGSGAPVLVLHGGGGAFTVAMISAHLATHLHVLTPTHPGWNGTPRPEDLTRVGQLAALYLGELEARGLREVTVVGSSMGGWIAAEMAAQDKTGIVGRLVLIDAVGIVVPDAPIPDFFGLTPRGIAEHSYHDPDRFYVDPATLPPERVAAQRANIATLRVFSAEPYMHDPSLAARLGQIRVPVLALWGESDRIVTPAYGRAFAAAIPDARFEIVPRAGHLPQLEQPDATLALIDGFLPQAR